MRAIFLGIGRGPKISSVVPGARSQNRLEAARLALDETEGARDDALGAIDSFREGILTKIPLAP